MEELKTLCDLPRGVDVEWRAEFMGERVKAGLIAVQKTFAVDEGTGAGLSCNLFSQLGTLYRQGVRGFGNDDPRDEISDGTDTGEETEESGEDTNQGHVPAVVNCKTRTDSCDHAIGTRPRELAGSRKVARRRRRSRGDCGSTNCTETGGRVDLLAALRTEHFRLRRTLFCHR